MLDPMQRVRGTQDLFEADSLNFRLLENIFFNNAKKYGFGEIKTPIMEYSDVFHRTLGESSDVVSKETYTFTDRSGESITLRPEGTAGIARAFISEGLAQKIPLKFYYVGPMFRHERPQKGRYRQFHQIGVEALGIESPLMDIECLQLAADSLHDIGVLDSCRLLINTLGDLESRQLYRDQLIAFYSRYLNDLSADSKVRLEKNPLRILDSKDEKDKKINLEAPKLSDHLTDSAKIYFDKVLKGLELAGLKFEVDQKLVRGLDYYTHTVFEFVTDKLGAQGTVLAGGRYDGLIQTMGGPKTPGIGWAAGVERLIELADKNKISLEQTLVAIIPADEQGEIEALNVAHQIRRSADSRWCTEIIYGGNVGKKMKKAAAKSAKFAIIIGSEEIQSQYLVVKNMLTGEQKSSKIQEFLNEHLL